MTKLQGEVDTLNRKYDEKDLALTNSDRDRKALAIKSDEINALYEDETRQKLALQVLKLNF